MRTGEKSVYILARNPATFVSCPENLADAEWTNLFGGRNFNLG